MKHNDIAIQLSSVSKKYTIHHEKPTLVEKFIKSARWRNEEFWALKDINLTINKGERVGIIGPNGSGKTTLLKIIVGITTPTEGTVKRVGKIVSLIDLEAGFHPELTGEQNIYINGMLLGLAKKDIQKNIQRIIAFADIKQFIDAPLFTYSSGMKLRLGFAVAVHADPDVLILDEGLSSGDSEYRKKIKTKIKDFFSKGKTIIMVSHQLDILKENCQTIAQMCHGSLTWPKARVVM